MRLSKSTQQKLFKTGYTAKGIVYGLIGFFAAATLIGLKKSGTNGPKAIIDWVGTNPFGKTLMVILGLGLLSYSVWRLYKAIADTEGEGKDTSGLVKRVAWSVSGTAYALLAFFAFRQVFLGGGGNDNAKQDMIARLLDWDYGQILVGILGVIFVGVSGYQAYRAISDKHMDKVKGQHLEKNKEALFRTTGRIGLSARAIIYGIIAYFLFKAAYLDDPSKFKGISDSMKYLENTGGQVALIVIGLGLLAYGLFMFIRARYERV